MTEITVADIALVMALLALIIALIGGPPDSRAGKCELFECLKYGAWIIGEDGKPTQWKEKES